MKLIAVAAGLLLLGCGSAAASTTSLRITAWGSPVATAQTWTLRCGPAGGTLPHPAQACRQLAQLRAPFAPLAKDIACTAIYGGPQRGRVRGIFRSARVDVAFNRTDGCQILRWSRVTFLFPIFVGTDPPPR